MKKLLIVMAALAAMGLGAPAASAGKCDPVITRGEDIAQVARNCPPSTNFTIKDGAYKLSGPVIADSEDTFKGVYSDKTRPTINANGEKSAFRVSGTNRVRISGLDISGAKGGDHCEPACGGAIMGDGKNLHVSNVRLHHNAKAGVSHPADGFLLENSEIDHNGSYSFTVMDRNNGKEPSTAAGIKTHNRATFRNNNIHDNYWIGIWCDGGGGPIVATGNKIYNNGKAGIQLETCVGGAIKNNNVVGNGRMKRSPTRRAGIHLQQARNVETAYNTVQNNGGNGIHVTVGSRQKTSGLRIHHNRLLNDTLSGCKFSGVGCRTNKVSR